MVSTTTGKKRTYSGEICPQTGTYAQYSDRTGDYAGTACDRKVESLSTITKQSSNSQEVTKTTTAAGVKRLALFHLAPSDDLDFGPQDWQDTVADHWDGPLIVGYDGMKIEL